MNYTKALNNPIFKIIEQASQELNLESYVIGGFVRDFILERDFKKDIDVVALGSGIELALKVSELIPNKPKVQVFKNYGTAMLRYKDIDIEFVGARKESYLQESRNPIVENGTLEDDQNRRDFTINALAITLPTLAIDPPISFIPTGAACAAPSLPLKISNPTLCRYPNVCC